MRPARLRPGRPDRAPRGTGDGGGGDGDGGNSGGDGGSGPAIVFLGGFSSTTSAPSKTDSVAVIPHAAGNAVVIAVGCAGSTLPTAVAMSAAGWTFTPLSPISGTSNGPWAATFGAIAPSAAAAMLAVTWTVTNCQVGLAELADELTNNDPTGGITAIGAGYTQGTSHSRRTASSKTSANDRPSGCPTDGDLGMTALQPGRTAMSNQGEKYQEISGKVTGYRVLDNGHVEVSFQGTGKLLGVDTMEIGTYVSQPITGGGFLAHGQGVAMTKDGETVQWKGHGIGKPQANGSFVWRYSVHHTTTSTKLARINTLLGVGDWEVDANGNCTGTGWEYR